MRSDASDGYSDDSMSEALEVSFDEQSKTARRASVVANKYGKAAASHLQTSCFVHSLLERHGKAQVHEQEAVHETQDKQTATPPSNGRHTDSRLLTKKQLSDMAFGIRELSKKLGHVRLTMKIKSIFLLTKAHDRTLIAKTRDVACWLLNERDRNGNGYTVWVEDTLKENDDFDAEGILAHDSSRKDRLKFWNDEICRKRPQSFDIALALGGDGTVLYASSLFQRIVPPVISFALGSLGFLTKFDFHDHRVTLSKAFEDGISLSLRLRFEGTVMRSTRKRDSKSNTLPNLVEELIGSGAEDSSTHRADQSYNILNEIVLDRGPNPTMSSIEVFGDDEHFTTVQADGICVATPTGSTAYNLAAGGSLCHPDNPVILLTAICAHTLNFRPIILPDTIVLRVGVPHDARASCWASFDGRCRTELLPGDYVTISASRFPFPAVLPLGRASDDWIGSISRTLNWNSRQRQKAFDAAEKKKEEKASEDA